MCHKDFMMLLPTLLLQEHARMGLVQCCKGLIYLSIYLSVMTYKTRLVCTLNVHVCAGFTVRQPVMTAIERSLK